MLDFKKRNPVIWEFLKNDFVVTKSTLEFVYLFDNQGREANEFV